MPTLSKPPNPHLSSVSIHLIAALFAAESLVLLLFALPGERLGLPETLLVSLATTLLIAILLYSGRRSALHAVPERLAGEDGLLLSSTEAPAGQRRSGDRATADSPAPGSAGPRALLITKNPRRQREIVDGLLSWGRSCDVVKSCVEASCHLLNQCEPGRNHSSEILIVDAQRLEMPPARFAAMIRKQPKLAQLRMLCLTQMTEGETARQLLQAGFDALVGTPVDKTELFAAIKGGEDAAAMPANVVPLGRYRQSRGRVGVAKTILLAEQNASTRSHLASLLRKAGHQVFSVENGEQALDTLETRNIDLAVVDLQLPILNGPQVIKLHRFTTPHRHWVPFIAITDENTPATLRLCRELQLRACLFKPVPDDELLRMIAATPAAASAPAANHEPLLAEQPRFHHSDLLDRRILHVLDQLDGGHGFLSELIEIFVSESDTILDKMRASAKARDRHLFIEQCQILLDNAGQLGAFALYEMCLGLMLLDSSAFSASAEERLSRLSTLVSCTIDAFKNYLAESESRHFDRN